MKKNFKSISSLIKDYRTASGLSQYQFSLKIGYKNGQFISNVERGLCSIPAKKLDIISKELNISKVMLINAMVEDYRNSLM